MSSLAETIDHVIGVDTHKHTHTAVVVVAATGGECDTSVVTTDPDGYDQLLALADRHPGRRVWAIEGTRSYGAGLCRFLVANGERVIEMERPHRPNRHGGVKSDRVDALRCAREALAHQVHAQPRGDGPRAALATLSAARRSAIEASTAAINELKAIVITASIELRQRLEGTSTNKLIGAVGRLRVPKHADVETVTTITALRALARRIRALQQEAADHESAATKIIRSWRPELLDEYCVGTHSAAAILCAWSHPGRFRNEAAFASLAGVAPLEATSGQQQRHRLNRYGDRQLNRALYTIVIHREIHDPTTRAYIQRRTAEGKTRREIRRCLKRYVARHLFRLLEHQPHKPLDEL